MVNVLATFTAFAVAAFLGCIQITNLRILHAPEMQDKLGISIPTATERRFVATLAVTESERNATPEALTRADRFIRILGNDRDALALKARLAFVHHDDVKAFDNALEAREMSIVDALIDKRVRSGRLLEAIGMRRQVVASVSGERTERELAADAYWRLGLLENLAAEQTHDRTHLQRASDAFEYNVALTPLSGRALLSAAYAELSLNDRVHAREHFTAALNADPASASALVGLARVALAEKNIAQARIFARHADLLAPAQGDVYRLHQALHL
jgi:tetratricopeptide (TPR) repeat protein